MPPSQSSRPPSRLEQAEYPVGYPQGYPQVPNGHPAQMNPNHPYPGNGWNGQQPPPNAYAAGGGGNYSYYPPQGYQQSPGHPSYYPQPLGGQSGPRPPSSVGSQSGSHNRPSSSASMRPNAYSTPPSSFNGRPSTSSGSRNYMPMPDPNGRPHPFNGRGPPEDYEKLARPYRHIMSSMPPQHPPGPAALDRMLDSAFEGLRLLDPEAADVLHTEGPSRRRMTPDISSSRQATPDNINSRKIRQRVHSMQLPPPAPMAQLQEDAAKPMWDERGNWIGPNPMREPVDEEMADRMEGKRRRKDGTLLDCMGCNTTTTPEWRRGPMGPRTLCNACGLVYAKLINKRKQYANAQSTGMPISPTTLFQDEANEGWGNSVPTTPADSLALIQRVRRSVVGGGHPRRPKDSSSSSGGSAANSQ